MDTVAGIRIDSNSKSDYHALLLALLVGRMNECCAFFVANLTPMCLVILLSRTEIYYINCPSFLLHRLLFMLPVIYPPLFSDGLLHNT